MMDEFGARIDAMHNRIADRLGKRPVVYFSAYKEDEAHLPVDNLDEIVIKGKAIFCAEHDEFWGPGHDYQSPIVEKPSWLDLAVLADEMIHTTGDTHHQFLEGVSKTKLDLDGIPVYRFRMGS